MTSLAKSVIGCISAVLLLAGVSIWLATSTCTSATRIDITSEYVANFNGRIALDHGNEITAYLNTANLTPKKELEFWKNVGRGRLVELSVQGCELSPLFLSQLATQYDVHTIRLTHCVINRSDGNVDWTALNHLHTIDLSHSDGADWLLTTLAGKSLKHVSVAYSDFNPENLSVNPPKLETLDASGLEFGCSFFEDAELFASLRVLQVENCRIPRACEESFLDFPSLQFVYATKGVVSSEMKDRLTGNGVSVRIFSSLKPGY